MHLVHIDACEEKPVSHDGQLFKRVLLTRNELPRCSSVPQVAQITLQPGQKVTRHLHSDMNEVFHVLDGSVHVYHQLEGQIAEHHLLQKGHCWVVHAGEWHWLEACDKQDCTLLYYGIIQDK